MNFKTKLIAMYRINKKLGYEFMPIGLVNDYSVKQVKDSYLNIVINNKRPIYSNIKKW